MKYLLMLFITTATISVLMLFTEWATWFPSIDLSHFSPYWQNLLVFSRSDLAQLLTLESNILVGQESVPKTLFSQQTLQNILSQPQQIWGKLSASMLWISLLLSGTLGLFSLIWGMRFLRLTYLFSFFPVSCIRPLALGQVLVRGRVMPSVQGLVAHPSNGKRGVYYAGVEQQFPKHRFYIEDKSGQIVVNPRQAIFLSTKKILSQGDKVFILAHKMLQPHRDKQLKILGKMNTQVTLLQRCTDFIPKFCAHAQLQILFSEPSNCFLIWDDNQQNPLGLFKGTVISLAIIFLFFICVTVFGLSGLSLLNI